MTQLKLFYDLMSQPARAVYIFCKINRIPFEGCPVALRRGEQRSDHFLSVNPLGLVPAINHNGFKLSESVAILQYLCREFSVADNWYPSESRRRALVDQYISWHHTNTRANCARFFLTKWLIPQIKNEPVDEAKLATAEKNMLKTLDDLEAIWLKERRFLAGQQISIGDLMAVCELEQPLMVNYDVFQGRHNLAKWYSEVKDYCSPFYQEAHSICERVRSKL